MEGRARVVVQAGRFLFNCFCIIFFSFCKGVMKSFFTSFSNNKQLNFLIFKAFLSLVFFYFSQSTPLYF